MSEMIKCIDAKRNPDICEQEFEFTERDQEFYKERGFTPPKRCKPCREKKKQRFNDNEQSNTN